MTIVVFLIDTSASMNQRIFLGGRPSLLDVAKSAVEYFVKVRQRSIESRGDRYMLLTFEEPPNNIKAGWKENLQTFTSELKNLQATGLTTLGQALRHTFDVLNVNRMQHGIDTYGTGRSPFYLEPSIIVLITDGGRLSSKAGVSDELKLHGSSPGCELTREPFRWDQRLFGLVLKMSGQPSNTGETGLVPPDDSPIELMCDATGGRSYSITNHRMLHQCIESIAQKVQSGVVLHFEKYGLDPTPSGADSGKDEEEGTRWHSVRRMILVPRSSQKTPNPGGFWPIPEPYWPDPNLPSLPPRGAHPNVKFVCQNSEPIVIENFPIDKYELEPNPLTQYILARKQPNLCWQVFVPNSSRNGSLGHAFGYLKPNPTLTSVQLWVLPYNYPMLFPLLQELIQVYRLKPTNEWRAQFTLYMSTVPQYYYLSLKRAITKVGAINIGQTINEEPQLSFTVTSYLKKLKSQAKIEYERTCAEVAARVQAKEASIATSSVKRINLYKNPFDVPRDQLLDHLSKLRSHFFRPCAYLQQMESLHNQPVSQMGNYQEYLKRMPTPLREIESTPVRQHMFGNPFKIDKRLALDKIDEADLDPILGSGTDENIGGNSLGNGGSTPTRKMKRKPGPLPKGYRFIPNKKRMLPYYPEEFSDDSPIPSPAPSSVTSSPGSSPIYESDNHVPIFDTNYSKLLDSSDTIQSIPSQSIGAIATSVMDSLSVVTTPSSQSDSYSDSLHSIEHENIHPVSTPRENGSATKEELGLAIEEEEEPARRNSQDQIEAELLRQMRMQEAEQIRKTNLRIRIELFKEIRRPLVRMDFMLSQMDNIAGPVDVKKKFIKGLEKEALRFKRRKLADIFIREHEKL